MILLNPSYEILTPLDGGEILRKIEAIGRVCYKSEDRITPESAGTFVQMLLNNQHLSVLEHFSFSVRFIIDRGVSHELVRHRLASFSQESTRYCNYGLDKFGNQVSFIIPFCLQDLLNPGHYPITWYGDTPMFSEVKVGPIREQTVIWLQAMAYAERAYLDLLDRGYTPQSARAVLPNSLKTEIVVTANLREWILILTQRTSKKAHPDMVNVMYPLLKDLQSQVPIIFDDI